jgi:hypothetical protein
MADSRTPGRVRFVITPEALLVANEGQPFDAPRVRSLTRLGSSDKAASRGDHHQIGYKGIGFTSVFEISDRPQVLSRDVGLAFDRTEAANLVQHYLGDGLDGPVPARYFPLPIRPGELGDDERVIAELLGEGAVTVVRLPLRADRDRDQILENVRETLVPETLLFMPVLRGLSIEEGERSAGWVRREASRTGIGRIVHLEDQDGRRSNWLVARGGAEVDPAVVEALDDELWAGVKRLNAAVAIPWSERGPRDEAVSRRVHSYFATDDLLGRSLLLHADFYLDSSRRRLELKGPGGEVTRAAADAVAGLAARLVESVGKWGLPLLSACVPVGIADAAGNEIGRRLEVALAEAQIARPFGGGPRRRPAELQRLGLDLERSRVERLMTVLDPSDDLLDPSDDVGSVRDLLDRLGCSRLGPLGVAGRVKPSTASEPYASVLGLLHEWLETTEMDRFAVLTVLRKRSVVQDQDERWRMPANVERRASTAPELPPALRRAELREPQSPAARALVDALQITVLEPASALGRLLNAIASRSYPTTNEDHEQALDLAYRIWLADSTALRMERQRVGSIRVRARTNRARFERDWRRADQTYFGADWAGDRTLEQLYAPLGEAEFLAEPLPSAAAERNRRRQFFEALGVAAAPRRVQISSSTTSHLYSWINTGGRGEAWECAAGHPQTRREITGWLMDRLDEVLDHSDDPETAAALAHGLVMLGEPYGPPVTVHCTHSGHEGVAHRKPVIGYQRWRLTEAPWVPVSNDPSGAALQVPSRAWRGLPARSPWLLVPKARLRPTDAEALGLVFAEHPEPTSVESALEALAKAYPDLAVARGDVRDTADWLARRLERVLTKGERRSSASPPLPAQGADGWRWSRSAAVPNVPGLPRIRGLDLLPPGRWTRLQRSYGLGAARDLVRADFSKGPVRRNAGALLPNLHRVHLLALLLRRGAESERTAARLAALREHPVAWLRLSWRVGEDVTPALGARFLLEPARDARGRVTGSSLYWTADERPGPVDLGRALAEHLEIPDDDAEIALFFQEARVLVEERGLTEGEINDADRLLRSRRYYRDDPARTPERSSGATAEGVDYRLDASQWQEPAELSGSRAAASTAPEKTYIDATAVAFGASTRMRAPERKKEAPENGGGRRAEPGAPARDLAKPLAPVGPEARMAAASGKRTEETAVAIVKRFGSGLPDVVEVVDVQDEDRGWDLEFRMRDGTFIPVEVKGSSGGGSFVITANEWEAARAHADYTLYHVVDLTTPDKTRMRVFRGLRDRLTDDRVSAAGWAVTRWQELEPEEIPVRPVEAPGRSRPDAR